MTAETVKIRNKLAHPLPLYDVTGDCIQLPVGDAWHNVPRAYIDFQAPSQNVAEIDGYDYATGSFASTGGQPPATVAVQQDAPEPEAAVVTPNAESLTGGNGNNQRNNHNGNNRPNNPQR